MHEWQVSTANKEHVDVKAHQAQTTPAGALVFSLNSGRLVRAFAPGAWVECVAKD